MFKKNFGFTSFALYLLTSRVKFNKLTMCFKKKQGLVTLICISFSRPVHGLIFLFKWQPGEEPAGSVVQDSRLDTIFFAKQVWSGVF